MHTFHRDSLTWMSYLLLGTFGFFINVLGPITPFLRAEMGLSHTLGSLHFTAFAAGMLLVGLVGYNVIERIGLKAALWLGSLGAGLSVMILVLARHPAMSIPATFILGSMSTIIIVIVPSALSSHSGEARSVALTEGNVVASVISAAAPLIVGLFSASRLGWRGILAVSALAPLLLFLAFRRVELPRSLDGERPGKGQALPRLYWVYWALIFLSVSCEYCMVYWSSDFLMASQAMSSSKAATAVSLFLGGMILGRFVSSRLVRTIAPTGLIIGSALVAALGFGLFWLPKASFAVLAGLFLCGTGIASLYPLLLSLAIGASGRLQVKATARATLASASAVLLLPLVLGSLADLIGIRLAYLVVPFLLLAILLVLVLGGKTRSQARP